LRRRPNLRPGPLRGLEIRTNTSTMSGRSAMVRTPSRGRIAVEWRAIVGVSARISPLRPAPHACLAGFPRVAPAGVPSQTRGRSRLSPTGTHLCLFPFLMGFVVFVVRPQGRRAVTFLIEPFTFFHALY